MDRGKCQFSGKTVYPTRIDARLALDKLSRRRHSAPERTHYPCPFCKGWHITREGEKRSAKTRMPPHQRWRWDGAQEEE